jgi:hypothetical protein
MNKTFNNILTTRKMTGAVDRDLSVATGTGTCTVSPLRHTYTVLFCSLFAFAINLLPAVLLHVVQAVQVQPKANTVSPASTFCC